MQHAANFLAKSPETVLVGLSRRGDRAAFAELVNRRQAWIRNLMRRCSGNAVLADDLAHHETPGLAMDLDRALATLAEDVRLCVVLSYYEQMTHNEIAQFTAIPLGTVKSHIRRGTKRLQEELSAYLDTQEVTT